MQYGPYRIGSHYGFSEYRSLIFMYPRYFNNQVASGDQLQAGSVPRADPRFRQDGARPQQLQNPYSSVNMGAAAQGVQYDPRFINGVNPTIPPNPSIPYDMVSNSYPENAKPMQMQYDRGLYSYPMPMQMMDMRMGGYQNVNPYYAYYGMRPGMPYSPMDRNMVSGYQQEYMNPMVQEKQPSAPAAAPVMKTTAPIATAPPSAEQSVTAGKEAIKHPEPTDPAHAPTLGQQGAAAKELAAKEASTPATSTSRYDSSKADG